MRNIWDVWMHGIAIKCRGLKLTCFVSSAVLEGSVLAQLLCIMYINYLHRSVTSEIILLTNDTNIEPIIRSDNDAVVLQEEIPWMCEWSKKYAIPFNTGKCTILYSVWINNHKVNIKSHGSLSVKLWEGFRSSCELWSATQKSLRRIQESRSLRFYKQKRQQPESGNHSHNI